MTDTIKRAECPECGRGWAAHAEKWRRLCSGVPVERTYVSVDALESRFDKECDSLDYGTEVGARFILRRTLAAINTVTGVKPAQCETCDGSGLAQTELDDCPSCHGTGETT